MIMGEPVFYIQIVHVGTGAVARVPGGGRLEADLTNLFVRYIMAKGVGFFKTEKHVEQDVRDGIKDAIMAMKQQTTAITDAT